MLKNSFRDANTGVRFIYPLNWETEIDGRILSVFNPEGVGALQFSIYESSEERVNAQDYLRSILKRQQINTTVVGEKNIAVTTFINTDGKYWKYWLLHKNSHIIFATYNCEEEDAEKEIKEIDEIVLSLTI
jgi:hypothetical protein